MPDINSHLKQANDNLKLIEHLVQEEKFWDWKITIIFYTCLHIVNAHLARISNLHYQRHGQTQNAIDPAFNKPTMIDHITYDSYRKLRNFSNRARYLSQGDNGKGSPESTYYVYSKHYGKALRHLNTVIKYFDNEYTDFNFVKIKVKCPGLTNKAEFNHLDLQ
jgi:hypothetical protein